MNTQDVNLFLKEYGLLLENLLGLLLFGGVFIFVIFQNIKNKNWTKVICKTVLVFSLIIISIFILYQSITRQRAIAFFLQSNCKLIIPIAPVIMQKKIPEIMIP